VTRKCRLLRSCITIGKGRGCVPLAFPMLCNILHVTSCTFKFRSCPYFVGFEVLTAVVMKSAIFWDITPCSPLKVNRRFGGTCLLHLQGRRISRARNERESRALFATCFHIGFLLAYYLDPNVVVYMYFLTVGWLSTDYTAL
jgi:dolichol kinase